MTDKRKIIVAVATSADGYIARSDGRVDWLDRPRPKDNYGMGEFFRSIDTILWGWKTFAPILEKGAKSAGYGLKVKNYVFTHHPPKKALKDVEFTSEPPGDFAKRLRAEPGKDIWIMGGAGLIGSFLDAGEIDEFSLGVVPTFIGEGIPLIEPKRRTVPLELLSTKQYPNGVVRLNYRVLSARTSS